MALNQSNSNPPPTADQTIAANQNDSEVVAGRTEHTESSYALGYQQALTLELTGRHAKFFADAFASEYETAVSNKLAGDVAKDYATDFAGPYAMAIMAFLKENSDILTASKLMPEAHSFAYTHAASYETKFKEIQEQVLDTQAKKAQAEEKQRLETLMAHEKEIKEQKELSNQEGYTQGYSEGKKSAATEFFEKGLKQGRKEGYDDGQKEGYKSAITQDYEDGLRDGKIEGYKKSAMAMLPVIIGTVGYLVYMRFFS